jgi:hypothetical protein
MLDTVFHKKSEFNQFDWNSLVPNKYKTGGNFGGTGVRYTFAKGGPGYPGGDGWLICMWDEEGNNHQEWELPDAISAFIDWAAENGQREKLKEIKRALGL